MMTDLEMTKLCAETMGINTNVSCDRYDNTTFLEIIDEHRPGNGGAYDPLHDDAQAMALVKKFDISIRRLRLPSSKGWFSVELKNEWDIVIAVTSGTDLNRAIVECVAKTRVQRTASVSA